MMKPIQNLHIRDLKALPSPHTLKDKFPLNDVVSQTVIHARDVIKDILNQKRSIFIGKRKESPAVPPGNKNSKAQEYTGDKKEYNAFISHILLSPSSAD
jgi:hypothetical protein